MAGYVGEKAVVCQAEKPKTDLAQGVCVKKKFMRKSCDNLQNTVLHFSGLATSANCSGRSTLYSRLIRAMGHCLVGVCGYSKLPNIEVNGAIFENLIYF